MTESSGKLKPLESPLRWFDELPLAVRLVLALDDLVGDWHATVLSAAAAIAVSLAVPTPWAIYGSIVSLAAMLVFCIRTLRGIDLNRNDEELRAALWQLGVRSPSLYIKRHPERIRRYWVFGKVAMKALGDRWDTRRAASAVALLALSVDDSGALGRIIDLVAERGLIHPTELLRLATASSDCRPLASGAL